MTIQSSGLAQGLRTQTVWVQISGLQVIYHPVLSFTKGKIESSYLNRLLGKAIEFKGMKCLEQCLAHSNYT